MADPVSRFEFDALIHRVDTMDARGTAAPPPSRSASKPPNATWPRSANRPPRRRSSTARTAAG